jgi:Imidazolonepropionase and related amidohydrolases
MSKVKADLLVRGAAELVTVAGYSERPKRGPELSDIGLIQDGAVAARDGVIVAAGTTGQVENQVELDGEALVIDAAGKVVTPGLVDPHTHVVFAGSREYELEMKIMGLGYLEILARGAAFLIPCGPPGPPASGN